MPEARARRLAALTQAIERANHPPVAQCVAEMLSLCGQTIDSRYNVESCIAEGGMGSVWRVRHLQTLQYFALKTLRTNIATDKRARRRFLQEARVTASIQSPHVVRIVDVNADHVHEGQSLPYLVMELVEGPSLAQVLALRRTISAGELFWTLRQVCDGLGRAHALGIVHRDLKPSNILLSTQVDREPVVKLCDFGIAKHRPQVPDGKHSSTEAGSVVGTPRYMAPEQLIKGGKAAAATDQWALAMTAFRCLAGYDYFDSARNGVELVLAIVHDSLPAPSQLVPSLPRGFDAWFLRSCERERNARFPHVLAQLNALHGALETPKPTPLELGDVDRVPREHQGVDAPPRPNVSRKLPPVLGWRSRLSTPITAVAGVLAVVCTNWMSGHFRAKLGMMTKTLFAVPELHEASGSVRRGETDDPALAADRARATGDRTLDVSSARSERTPEPSRKARTPTKRVSNPSRASRLLPLGATCSRSAQCEQGVCLAEVCQ